MSANHHALSCNGRAPRVPVNIFILKAFAFVSLAKLLVVNRLRNVPFETLKCAVLPCNMARFMLRDVPHCKTERHIRRGNGNIAFFNCIFVVMCNMRIFI